MAGFSVLNRLGNVRFREHECLARNPDDALVRTATRAEAELADGGVSDVHADDGEITVFEFEDVGAALERGSFRTVGVRIGANASSDVQALLVPMGTSRVNKIVR